MLVEMLILGKWERRGGMIKLGWRFSHGPLIATNSNWIHTETPTPQT
jgi:hypothetical protein